MHCCDELNVTCDHGRKCYKRLAKNVGRLLGAIFWLGSVLYLATHVGGLI